MFTMEGLLTCVGILVNAQVVGERESLSTAATMKGPLTCVGTPVPLHVRGLQESLVASRANVFPGARGGYLLLFCCW